MDFIIIVIIIIPTTSDNRWSFIYQIYFNEIIAYLNCLHHYDERGCVPLDLICHIFLPKKINQKITHVVIYCIAYCVQWSVSTLFYFFVFIYVLSITLFIVNACEWRISFCKQETCSLQLRLCAVECVMTDVTDYYCVTEYLLISGSR